MARPVYLVEIRVAKCRTRDKGRRLDVTSPGAVWSTVFGFWRQKTAATRHAKSIAAVVERSRGGDA